MQLEVEERFSHGRQRLHPYLPRHTYTAPIRSRVQSGRSSSGRVFAIAKTFTRDVVLLAPSETSVPRGTSRSVLHDEGRIIDMVDFNSAWDADKMAEKIEQCFNGVLDASKPFPR